jgi:hypothetical protein
MLVEMIVVDGDVVSYHLVREQYRRDFGIDSEII